jgi:hypothetical protein
VNQFTERYRTEERKNMRLREVMSLVIESLLLKKKIGRKKKEGTRESFYRQKVASIGGAL